MSGEMALPGWEHHKREVTSHDCTSIQRCCFLKRYLGTGYKLEMSKSGKVIRETKDTHSFQYCPG
eukprot:2952604-Rhodomonas_salina.2